MQSQNNNLLPFPQPAQRIHPFRRLAQDLLTRHEQYVRLRRVKMDVHAAAAHLGHTLGAFLPCPPDDLLVASCFRCGAGATLTPESAAISVSPQLEQPCPRGGR